MTEFWEAKFKNEKTLWGFESSDSAILTKNFFLENNIKDILIPGIGYGRNAKVFIDNNIKVSGIEISDSAIKLANKEFGKYIHIFHGSVIKMPFDDKLYEGIFCYALLHLLNKYERNIFINNCYNQLKINGFMFFTVVSKKTGTFGEGKKLSTNRYKLTNGLNVFFYDSDSIKREFKDYGLIDFNEIDEPIKFMEKEPPLKCFLIKCKRKE